LAALAIAAGLLLTVEHPTHLFEELRTGAFHPGTGYALLCALFWGLATVAGRGVMEEVPLAVAGALRVCVGLACMAVIAFAMKPHHVGHLPPLAPMLKMVTIAGALPLLIYFEGLRHTRASIAGYFEQVQTIVAAFVGWAFLGGKITALQLGAAAALLVAIVMVQRVQAPESSESSESSEEEPAPP
jgi:drug/metabolite transporter (DMT)-like permease